MNKSIFRTLLRDGSFWTVLAMTALLLGIFAYVSLIFVNPELAAYIFLGVIFFGPGLALLGSMVWFIVVRWIDLYNSYHY